MSIEQNDFLSTPEIIVNARSIIVTTVIFCDSCQKIDIIHCSIASGLSRSTVNISKQFLYIL